MNKFHDWGEPEPNPHSPKDQVRYTCKVCGLNLFCFATTTMEEIRARENENDADPRMSCDGYRDEVARQVMES